MTLAGWPTSAQRRTLGLTLIAALLTACAAGPRKPVAIPDIDYSESPAATADDPSSPQSTVDSGDAQVATTEEAQWLRHERAIQGLGNWKARGKVAYRLPEDGGSANLIWEQTDGLSELSLSGPLGAGSTQVRNDGPLISVRRDGIERRYPADAAPWLPNGALMPIPIDSIQYWLRGIPDPGRPVDELTTENGLALIIRQEGWSVAFDEYHAGEPEPLPKRLRIEASQVNLSLRTYLRQWSFSED